MFSKRTSLDTQAPATTDGPTAQPSTAYWRVLIVDDEPDIHTVTEMALGGVRIEGRELEFLHAHSGAEAKQVLATHPDIALVLLDVVMEDTHAGLEVARFIREDLDNTLIRIVLRTGQPGEAPEEQVFVTYDINDYKEKTELDRRRLFTTVYSAIRAYRDLMRIETSRKYLLRNRAGLERVIHASSRLFETRSITDFARGLLEQITSVLFIDSSSMIVQAQGASAVGEDQTHWQIITTTGDLHLANAQRMDEVSGYLQQACRQRRSLFLDDRFVGYFETRSGRVTLVYVEGCDRLDELSRQLLDIFSVNVTTAFENISLEKEIADTQNEIILRLGDVLETRSRETGNHVRRLAAICHLLGRKIGLSEDECDELRNASPMHDIGKIAIPDRILLKPGKLSAEEFEEMKYHAEAGYQILCNSNRPLMISAATIAHQHHERYDGTGYPQGLQGESIHLYARIVAVVDVFDALMHRRCYKAPWALEQTLDALREGRGSHFDPRLVDHFLEIVPEALAIIEQYPDSQD